MNAVKKYSRKREAVLEKIRETTSHPTAEWIYEEVKKEIPDLSLGTVYRNLAVFKDEGLIISVGVVDGQERFDANTREHTHFVCLDCGDVIDIDADIGPACDKSVENLNGLNIMYRQLTLYGKCSRCGDKTSHSKETYNLFDGGKKQ